MTGDYIVLIRHDGWLYLVGKAWHVRIILIRPNRWSHSLDNTLYRHE
jgi:hypothetical protein